MNRMKELREAMGLNMKEAAAALSMPYTTYVNYEKGVREPSSDTLIQIASFFQVSIDYLLCRPNAPRQAECAPVSRSLPREEIMFALFRGREDVTDEMFDEVQRFADFVSQREQNKNKG